MADPTLLHVAATVHGRILVDAAAGPPVALVLGFHGYGETAEEQLDRLRRTRGEEPWLLASIQALHPFYRRRDRAVVASWMTRVDRELAIADNTAYVEAAWRQVVAAHGLEAVPVVLAGFSQGVAMACRAARRVPAVALVITGSDVPAELSDLGRPLPPALLVRGRSDEAYSMPVWRRDQSFLRELGGEVEALELDGGHEWTDELADRARAFIRAQIAIRGSQLTPNP